ncbi:MAG: hypothetical protein M3R21_07115, partial [Candidatus Dormibacteraeota bacterium]|nr:hypothetical protein [Candidatus Dormibacteraeota bacterium]
HPILRDDAARCVVETLGRTALLGKIVELGGPEVVTWETVIDWFRQARGVRKPKLHLPVPLLLPGAVAMETLLTNPIATPDEINMTQLNNIAAGIDSVSSNYGWRPTALSQWAPVNWKKPPKR